MILRRRALLSVIAAGALALCWQPKRGDVLVLAFVAPPPRCHSCYAASTPNTRSSRRRVANTIYGWGEDQGMYNYHQDVASMRVEEIKQELERYGISTKDLLAAVLQKARAAGLEPISQDHNRNQLKASSTTSDLSRSSSNSGETSMRQGRPRIPEERPVGQDLATLKAYELELKEALRKHRGGMTVISKQDVAGPRPHQAERPDEDDLAAFQAMKAYENQLKQQLVVQQDGRGLPITSAAASSKTRDEEVAFQPTTTNENERKQQQELRNEQRGMTTTSASSSSSTTGTTREDNAAIHPMKAYENKLEQQKRSEKVETVPGVVETQEPGLKNRSESLQAAVAEVRQQIGASSQEESPKYAEAEVLSIEEMEVLEMEKSKPQKGDHWWNAYGKEDYAHMEVLTHKADASHADNKQHRNRWWNADPSEYADMEVLSENEDSASSANDNKEQRKRWWNADPSGYADMDSFSGTTGQVQQPHHEEKPWWNTDPTEYTDMANLPDG